RHQAAVVVIGRRSLGHRARRRPDVTDAHPQGPREINVFVGWASGWAADSYRYAQRGLRLLRALRRLRTPGGDRTHVRGRGRVRAQLTEDRSLSCARPGPEEQRGGRSMILSGGPQCSLSKFPGTGATMAAVNQNGPRVLVVDDEPNITELVALALRYEGFTVQTAATGRAAVATVAE